MPDPTPAGEQQADGAAVSSGGDSISIAGNIINSTIIVKSIVRDDQVVDLEALPPEAGEPPYKGLQYFDEGDASLFFGREQLTARLIGRLHRSRFLAIIGASGSGKSSVVRAGIIPALRSGRPLADGSTPPPESTHWTYRVLTPGGHPLDALAACLLPGGELPSQVSRLRDELLADPRSLGLAAQSLLSAEKSPRLLLVVDQFEEIFTLARDPQEREAFINALIAVSSPDDSQPVSVLTCLRADFYAQVAQHDRLREMVSQFQEFIGAMSRSELVDAIVGPLSKENWRIQEGLVKVILNDAGFEPGSLPLLSHALLETWERRHGRTLTLSGYVDCGGVEGAIRETADSVFKDRLQPDQQAVARMIFLRLAELNEDAQDTRRRAPFSELITRSTDELTIQTVINILVDARLVTTSTVEPGDLKVVEVAHESLIREWPTLRNWLNEDRQGLILHRQLTDAAEDWVKNNRDDSLVFRGSRLKQVEAWAARSHNADSLSLQDIEFVQASQEEARREARKEARVRATQVVFGAVIVALLVLVGILLRPKPPVMNAPYNVVVADVGEILPTGQVREMASGTGATNIDMGTAVEQALQPYPGILVWSDRADLRRQGVQIGALTSDTPEGQPQAAADLARRLHADMVIYGAVDRRTQPPVLTLQVYLTPNYSPALGEIAGNFQFNPPIPLAPDLQTSALQTKVAEQANFLSFLTLGQYEDEAGRTLEALEYYLKAADLAPASDELQFFIGREYLFSVERRPIPPEADPAFEKKAVEALQKALQLNPHNSQAYIALGTAHIKQAQPLISNAASTKLTADELAQVVALLDQAQAAYEQVLQPGSDAAQPSARVKDVGRLGLGETWLLRGNALELNGQVAQARDDYQQAIQILQQTLPAFNGSDPQSARYLAQNHQYLGNAYQWSGFLSDVQRDFPTAVQAYQQAVQQFNACIAVGKTSSDLVIVSDIVGDNCQPMLDATEKRLKQLQ